MLFKYRYNCIYRELRPVRDGTVIEIAPDWIVPWLGLIDRCVARALVDSLGAEEVSLSYAGFQGWKLGELDSWIWISDQETFVGCVIEQGAFVVTDAKTPLLKPMAAFSGDFRPRRNADAGTGVDPT